MPCRAEGGTGSKEKSPGPLTRGALQRDIAGVAFVKRSQR